MSEQSSLTNSDALDLAGPFASISGPLQRPDMQPLRYAMSTCSDLQQGQASLTGRPSASMTSVGPPSLQLGCYPSNEVGSAGPSRQFEDLDVMDAENSISSSTTMVADILESPFASADLQLEEMIDSVTQLLPDDKATMSVQGPSNNLPGTSHRHVRVDRSRPGEACSLPRLP